MPLMRAARGPISLLVVAGAALLLPLAACAPAPADDDDGGAPDDGGAASGDAGVDDEDGGAADEDAGAGAGDAGHAATDAGVVVDASSDAGAGGDAGGTTAGYGAYDADGPHAVTMSELDVVRDDLSQFVVLVFTSAAPAPRPVVVLSPGLLQPDVAYTSFGLRLASHGIDVFVRGDPGGFTATTDVTADLTYFVSEWLPAQNADATSALHDALDLDRVGLAGHSRGGKASLIAAEDGLNGLVDGWFGLDPVDAAEFSGGVQAQASLDQLDVPTAYLGASVTSSCSPANSNYTVLYADTPSPSVQITGVGAGHTQLEDAAGCTGCSLCSPSGTADDDVVLDYAVRYLTAFFARELLDDATVGAAFQGAGVALDVAAGHVAITSK